MEARSNGARPLVVSCLSTLAARWLIPRLPRLSRAAPRVTLDIRESDAPLSSNRQGCDLAIRMRTPGDPLPPGLVAHAFMATSRA